MAAVEQKKSYQVIKQFEGLNTKANRTAISENQFSWLENLMPIGYANIKSLKSPRTIPNGWGTAGVFSMFSANINNKDYLIAFKTDGSCVFFDVVAETFGNIKTAGFFSSSGMNVSQFKNTEVLILDPVKGYFTWNGTNLVSVGSVGAIFITNGGTGYTSAPTVTIGAPNDANGVQATATCSITANVVTSISLTEAGSGYTVAPSVTFSGGGGTNAAAIAGIVDFKTGTVSALVTNGGSGYTNSANTVVTISGGGGTNAAATAVLAGGKISGVVITNPGQNYTNQSNLSITITGGGGAGAIVKGIVNKEPNTGIASFSGRVWIATGRNISYSAAGSLSDFVTVSAGTIVLTDSTLRGNIVQILSANNFLYIFGQDSINVFSDVRVTGTGVTLFTNTNISASVGSKFDYAIFPYFRSVLFMNDYGVYALVGSTTSKLSDPLDGIFQYIDFATSTVTAGQVLINNILCAAFNIKYNDTNDPYGYKYLQAVFFEKKWFFASQGNDLKIMVSIPVNGQPRLYATNGANLQQLYADPDRAVFSRVQTALMPMGDPIRTKQALKFAIEATLNTTGTALDVTIDSERQQSQNYVLSNNIDWLNNGGEVVSWANSSLDTISWAGGTGYNLYKSDAQQWGKYLGLTVETTSKSYVLSGFEFEHELRVRF
jgi:hypothetical protein